ncbi:MAG: DUF4340 domain-containing protein [Thioalkalispiraceae bacterium]|jgi:hypothetical protein
MSSRNLLNLILMIIVIGLVLVVIYKPGKEDKVKRITSLDKNNVTDISIKRTGKKSIRLVKKDNVWRMLEPYKLKANKIKVESLLDLLNYKYHTRYAMEGLDAKKFGLDIPRTTLTYNKTEKFEFGTTEPINRYRYIRYNNTLYLTDDYFYYRILGKATDFLDHALIEDNKKIKKIELPGLTLTLKDAKWEASPRPEKYNNDRANELIEHWQLTHGIEIVDYPPAKGTGQVRVYLNNDKPIHFDIFTINDEFYLGRKDLGIAYKLAKEKRRDLLQLPPPIETQATGAKKK